MDYTLPAGRPPKMSSVVFAHLAPPAEHGDRPSSPASEVSPHRTHLAGCAFDHKAER